MHSTALSRFMIRLFGTSPSRARLERAYLDASVSLYDPECREREVERGKFAGR